MFSFSNFGRISVINNGILKTFIGLQLEISSRQFQHTCYVSKAHESGNKTKRNLSKGQPRATQKQLQQLVMADTHFMQRQKAGVLQVFPNVPSTIKNMYYNLSTNLNPAYRYEQSVSAVGRVNNQLVFQCSSKVRWPRPLTFQGYGFSKKNAELVAMLKILEMLREEKYISEDGYPITISSEEQEKIRKEWNSPVPIRLPVSLMEEGFSIIQNFHKEIKPQMDMKTDPTAVTMAGLTEESDDEFGIESCTEDIDEDNSFCWEEDKENNYVQDIFTGRQYIEPSREENIYRSQKMLQQLQAREMSEGIQPQASLPMSHYREALQTALDKNRVVVIAGDTGCGKSTQVPQMIKMSG
ncbi:ATP-dependent RNA helicase DHX30-like [Penaeus monodon]|uniref:ATP-dependent RNA helicase DHX30-like n=1 Tax=Penaeus monodon TaxID=6687 RepID=UPI0018A76FEF|nr:ATP-dependent RNA helicase DHX30-like [Penaeus monodon]